ncbi:50S ribosomal protein L1 [Rhodohalobacter barkolensis]|uniref:Large ribosomal subunit protein uL1 n=1 Tax=Rhodohalobacter barkolensis TaxID=2053187 RepID=A0A2N0VM68_9BACT|nr:50S ribosomal protein L1 [Rhodohalobacter barkolensis]PKD45307.1 50S ribosomal protein L1 [Rhodohalobacter barkolensis]
MAKRGKKYQKVAELFDHDMEYTIEEACDLIKQTKTANFDESVDLDLRLGVDPRHADQMVRGTVSLPHGTGKSVRVLALVNEAKQEEAKEAGADFVGLDEYIEKIEEGWADIDVIIATPDVMGKIGKLGRHLGPRGLMPNPKSGTVTMDVADAVKEFKQGKIDFRVDKQGILHTSIGKASFDVNEIRENLISFLQTILKLRPASAKGIYIRSAYISTTMGPSISLSRSSITSI